MGIWLVSIAPAASTPLDAAKTAYATVWEYRIVGGKKPQEHINSRAPSRGSMARRRPPQVERKIYFYRVDAGQDAGARPLQFDPRAVLRHIEDLGWEPQGRYMLDADDNALCCWIDRMRAPQRLRFG